MPCSLVRAQAAGGSTSSWRVSATGAHPKRLRKLLHAAGYIRSEALSLTDDAVVFDANEAQEFLDCVAEAMSLNDAREYLDVPRPRERHLIEAGYLQPFVMGGAEILKDHAFAKRDLDAFLQRLLAGVAAALDMHRDHSAIPENESPAEAGRSHT